MYEYPYLSCPYSEEFDRRIREQWLKNASIIGESHKPTDHKHLDENYTKANLPYLLNNLFKIIEEDYFDYDFTVMLSDDEQICVRFVVDQIDSEDGLKAYMNTLILKSDRLNQYNLHRDITKWGINGGDGYIYYLIRPPWICNQPSNAYNLINYDGCLVPSKHIAQSSSSLSSSNNNNNKRNVNGNNSKNNNKKVNNNNRKEEDKMKI